VKDNTAELRAEILAIIEAGRGRGLERYKEVDQIMQLITTHAAEAAEEAVGLTETDRFDYLTTHQKELLADYHYRSLKDVHAALKAKENI
jgi:hypothetical protein